MSFDTWAFGKSGNEITDDYEERVGKGLEEYNKAYKDTAERLKNAQTRGDGTERTISSSLDEYDRKQKAIQQGLANQQDASLNWGTDQMATFQNNVAPAVGNAVAGASASRVFGTNTNAGQQAMNNASANNWNTALNQGSAIGSLNTSVLGSQANMAEQKLTNDAMPQQDALSAEQDWANTNLSTNTQMAGNRAKTEMNERGWAGDLATIVGKINSK